MKVCDNLCQECTSSKSAECNVCISGAVINDQGQCQCKNYQIIGGNKCVEECPQGYKIDKNNRFCILNKEDQQCKEWIQDYCVECLNSNYVNVNGTCLLREQKETHYFKENNPTKQLNSGSRYLSNKSGSKSSQSDKNPSSILVFERVLNQIDLSVSKQNEANIGQSQARLLEQMTNICKLQDPNCLLCSSKESCQICHNQYYNFSGKCYTELKLVDYVDQVKLAIIIVSSFLFASALVNSIVTSCYKNPNSILLNTSLALQKIFFLNLISIQLQIQTSDLFSAFQYVNPFKIFKSTSWINATLSSQQDQPSTINFIFNYNDVDGNIIFTTSGCILLMTYILIIYLIFVSLIKKSYYPAFDIYQKVGSGLIFQLLAQGVQILFLGIILQIVFFASTSYDVSSDSLFALKVIFLIISSLLVIIVILFLYRQTNISLENPVLKERYSIQDVNRKAFLCDCYNVTWTQRNYNFLVIIKECLFMPVIIVCFKDLFFAAMMSLIAIESIHLVLSVYVRPFKTIFDNFQCILGSVMWLTIFIIKLASLILCNELEFSNKYSIDSSDKTLSSLKRLEIALIFLILFVLLTIQLIPIFKFMWLKKIENDNQQPLIRQIDSLKKIQLTAYGYYRENPSMFKIREDALNEVRFKQNYKNFKGSGRMSVSTMLGNSQIQMSGNPSMASFSPSPILSPIKIWNPNKSRDSINESQYRKTSLFVLNNTSNATLNNNSFLQQSDLMSKYPQKKNSTSNIPLIQINELQKETKMNQISELKEEYTSDNPKYHSQRLNKPNSKNSSRFLDNDITNQNMFSKKSQNSSRLSYSSSSSGSSDSSECNESELQKDSFF